MVIGIGGLTLMGELTPEDRAVKVLDILERNDESLTSITSKLAVAGAIRDAECATARAVSAAFANSLCASIDRRIQVLLRPDAGEGRLSVEQARSRLEELRSLRTSLFGESTGAVSRWSETLLRRVLEDGGWR